MSSLRMLPITAGRWCLKQRHGSAGISWRVLAQLRRLSSRDDALCFDLRSIETSGRSLRNSVLATKLATHQLGTWSLCADSLDFLETRIQALRPQLILEFGSGISTACLAQYMRDVRPRAESPSIISIEQSTEHANATRQLLRDLDLTRHVHLIVCPVRDLRIEGRQTRCYDIGGEFRSALGTRGIDFVVIDGPADIAGSRFATLPLIRNCLNPGAPFFLDDALRDGELEIARHWDQLPYIHLNGIHLVGKGLLSGVVSERQ